MPVGPGPEAFSYAWTVNGSLDENKTERLEGLACLDEVICTLSSPGLDPVSSPLQRPQDSVALVLGLRELDGALRCEKTCGQDPAGPFEWRQQDQVRPGPVLWPQDRGEEATCWSGEQALRAPAAPQAPRTRIDISSKDEAWLAFSAAWVGDMDGDGGAELALGTPYWNTPRPKAGGVAVLWSETLGTQDSHSPSAVLTGEGSADLAGWSVAPAGDVDQDGLADLLVGIPGDERGGYLAGAVALFTAADLQAGRSLSGEASHLWTGDAQRMWSGTAVAGGQDLDGDGALDVLIGAYGTDGDSGAVFLLSAESPSGPLNEPVLLGPEGSATGLSLAILGDSDGDGLVEWAAGAPLGDGLYLVEQDEQIWMAPSDTVGGRFGWTLAPLGDWDGDGLDDLAASEPLGDTWVYAGGTWQAQGQASTELAALQTAQGPLLLVSHEGALWSVENGVWTEHLDQGVDSLTPRAPLDFGEEGTLLIGDHSAESALLWLGLPQ